MSSRINDATMDEEDQRPLTETVEASMLGEDEPMEEVHPVATAAMVSLTYPVLLLMILLVALFISAFMW